MFADYHLHTSFSDDSRTPMEDMVLRAIHLGLDEVCFTEHVDHGIKTVLNCDYAAYFAEMAARQGMIGVAAPGEVRRAHRHPAGD